MGLLFCAFLTGLTLLFVALAAQIDRERARTNALRELELEPNCLLTRHPLVFLAGGRSLFRIFEHWNQIPRFLREHGYEVLVLEPPAGFGVDVEASLMDALRNLPEACHLIADSSLESTLEAIARTKHPQIASLNLVRNSQGRSLKARRHRVQAADLRPPAHAIDVFEVRSPSVSASGPRNLASRALLAAHNLSLRLRHLKPVDPIETAELNFADPWLIERRFLRLAVTLAERDLEGENPLVPSEWAAASATAGA